AVVLEGLEEALGDARLLRHGLQRLAALHARGAQGRADLGAEVGGVLGRDASQRVGLALEAHGRCSCLKTSASFGGVNRKASSGIAGFKRTHSKSVRAVARPTRSEASAGKKSRVEALSVSVKSWGSPGLGVSSSANWRWP